MGLFSADENPAYIELEHKYDALRKENEHLKALLRERNITPKYTDNELIAALLQQYKKLLEENLDLKQEINYLKAHSRTEFEESIANGWVYG